MGWVSPEVIQLRRQALTLLHQLLALPAPEEGCALLLGVRAGVTWRIERIWPCLNSWEPPAERRRHFSVDPREQLQAQRWARSHGWLLLGAAHSHPTSVPRPSASDLARTAAPALMLIRGCDPAGRPELGCWWLPEQGAPRRLAWRMEP